MISDIVFGHTYNLLGDPEHRYITHAIEASNVRISVFVQEVLIAIFRMDKKLFPAAVVARNQFLKFMRALVARSMEIKHVGDVFGIMLDAKDPETNQGLTPNQTAAEATTLLVAGKSYTHFSLNWVPNALRPQSRSLTFLRIRYFVNSHGIYILLHEPGFLGLQQSHDGGSRQIR